MPPAPACPAADTAARDRTPKARAAPYTHRCVRSSASRQGSRSREVATRAAQMPLVDVTRPQLVEQHVDDRRRQERQQLTRDQPADDRDAERLAQLGAFAEADCKR